MVHVSAATDFYDTGDWTAGRLAEFLREPRDHDLDWRRFEIVDGVLVVSPQPSVRHSWVVDEVTAALRSRVPAHLHVSGAVEVPMGRSYRVTDVTVINAAVGASTASDVPVRDILLAVEVESPSSITTDRITKPAQYAAAGIPSFWRIETDPLRLIAYRLEGDVYAEVGSWGADQIARISEPFAVDIAVGSLLPS